MQTFKDQGIMKEEHYSFNLWYKSDVKKIEEI